MKAEIGKAISYSKGEVGGVMRITEQHFQPRSAGLEVLLLKMTVWTFDMMQTWEGT